MSDVVWCQVYYIDTKDKRAEESYYFKIMDSLVLAAPKDSFYECFNCVVFMKRTTQIPSSGNITYFGQFDFTKEDLQKWHAWYNKEIQKATQIIKIE
jgi:hypothetical protein